jgi:hypothetical protein
VGEEIMAISLFSMFMFAVNMIMQRMAASAARKRQKKMEREAKERADAAKGFSIPAEGESSVLGVQYGRGVLGGVRVFFATSNNLSIVPPAPTGLLFHKDMGASRSGVKHEFLTMQVALGHGGLSNCVTITVDGLLYSDDKWKAKLGDKDGLDKNRLMGGHRFHVYPSGTIVDPLMTANTTKSPLFTNTAYATCIFALNRDDYQYSGAPDVRFYVEGMKVASILGTTGNRSISTVKTYSNNPALCLLDYLTNSVYGRGLTADYIDLDSFYHAYLICERVVNSSVTPEGDFWAAKGGIRSLKLYECNLAISPARPMRDNIETILETMGQAELVWSGGKYKLSLEYPTIYNGSATYEEDHVVESGSGSNVDYYRSLANNNTFALTDTSKWAKDVISAYITDDDILRNSENSVSWPSAQERYNFVTVRFLNESKDFSEDSVAWPSRPGSIPGPAIDRGVWSPQNSYGKSDIVTYSGGRYQLAIGINYSGLYNVSTPYVYNDRVLSGSTVYRCEVANTGQSVLNTTYWKPTQVTPITDPAWVVYNDLNVYNVYRQEDNGMPLEADFFESGISDYYHALAKAEQRVRSSRASTVYKLTLITRHTNLEPGDFIKVNSSVLNIPGEVIRVEEIKVNNKGQVEIVGSKFSATVLAWNVGDTEIIATPNIFDTNVAQCTNLAFTNLNTGNNLSSGRLTFTPPADIRVISFSIKYTLSPVGSIDGTTTWIDLGETTNDYFALPSMATANYTLTVVANSKDNMAPRDNGLGSKWPTLGVGLNAVAFDSAKYIPVTIYTRSISAPATPTGGTFNFITLTMSVLPVGWTLLPPVGSDPLYASQAVASTLDVNVPDTTFTWSAPSLFSDAAIDVTLTKSFLGVGTGFDGTTPIYTEAFGNFKILIGGTVFTTSNEVTYSLVSQTNCTVTINNTAGNVDKGKFQVTNLAAKSGEFKVRAVIRSRTYDFLVAVVAVKDAYIKDLTPPPAPTGLSVQVGLNTVFLSLPVIPTYTQGHGHLLTRVYAVSSFTSLIGKTAGMSVQDLVATCTSLPATFQGVRASVGISTGTLNWSVVMSGSSGHVGIGTSAAILTEVLGLNNLSAIWNKDGTIYYNNLLKFTGTANNVGDVLSFSLNLSAGTLTFTRNSVLVYTLTGIAAGLYFPVFSADTIDSTATFTLPLPDTTNSLPISEFTGKITSLARNVNEQLRVWIKFVSVDGVESPVYGGTNGIDAHTLLLGPNDIAAESITADKLFVQDLSAISADLGLVTAGAVQLDTAGYIAGGQQGYDVGSGFFLGYDVDNYKLSIGNQARNMTWDGTSLVVRGTLEAADGTFAGSLDAATGTFSGSLNAATGTFGGTLLAGVLDLTSAVGISTLIPYQSTPYIISVPAGKTSARFTLFSGGGAGGGYRTPFGASGGGSSGTKTIVTIADLTAGEFFSISIGAGGAQSVGTVIGANGGNTTVTRVFGNTLLGTCPGGVGGGLYSPPAGSASTGGLGGIAPVGGVNGINGGNASFAGTKGSVRRIPIGGLGGSGNGTQKGGKGGSVTESNSTGTYVVVYTPGEAGENGYAIAEFFNPNSVVLMTQYSALKAEIARQIPTFIPNLNGS